MHPGQTPSVMLRSREMHKVGEQRCVYSEMKQEQGPMSTDQLESCSVSSTCGNCTAMRRRHRKREVHLSEGLGEAAHARLPSGHRKVISSPVHSGTSTLAGGSGGRWRDWL